MILHLHTRHLDDMSYSSRDIECDRLKLGTMGHFLPFYTPLPKNLKNLSFENVKKIAGDIILHVCTKTTIIWGMVPEIWGETFFCHSGSFFPFYTTNNPQNPNFEKMTKASGDVIILHKCTKYHNHMMYFSWDIECDRHNFLSSWAIFCPLIPLTTRKIKISKK